MLKIIHKEINKVKLAVKNIVILWNELWLKLMIKTKKQYKTKKKD